jgi:hypothetical protein
MPTYLCVTCGTQFAPSAEPPRGCPICLDERQYVGPGGQQWTTLEDLRETHRSRVEEIEPGLVGIGVEPSFAIGQRALHVESLLWDCVPLVDDGATQAIETIAVSHPHYYTTMVDWAERFDARVLLHEDDREWVMRPSPRIEYWSPGAVDAIEVERLHDAADALDLHGGQRVSFMWSYPKQRAPALRNANV